MEFATSVSNTFRELADSFDIKYDRFIRTTDADHKVAVEALWEPVWKFRRPPPSKRRMSLVSR